MRSAMHLFKGTPANSTILCLLLLTALPVLFRLPLQFLRSYRTSLSAGGWSITLETPFRGLRCAQAALATCLAFATCHLVVIERLLVEEDVPWAGHVAIATVSALGSLFAIAFPFFYIFSPDFCHTHAKPVVRSWKPVVSLPLNLPALSGLLLRNFFDSSPRVRGLWWLADSKFTHIQDELLRLSSKAFDEVVQEDWFAFCGAWLSYLANCGSSTLSEWPILYVFIQALWVAAVVAFWTLAPPVLVDPPPAAVAVAEYPLQVRDSSVTLAAALRQSAEQAWEWHATPFFTPGFVVGVLSFFLALRVVLSLGQNAQHREFLLGQLGALAVFLPLHIPLSLTWEAHNDFLTCCALWRLCSIASARRAEACRAMASAALRLSTLVHALLYLSLATSPRSTCTPSALAFLFCLDFSLNAIPMELTEQGLLLDCVVPGLQGGPGEPRSLCTHAAALAQAHARGALGEDCVVCGEALALPTNSRLPQRSPFDHNGVDSLQPWARSRVGVALLSCGHVYHALCLSAAEVTLTRQGATARCPTCRCSTYASVRLSPTPMPQAGAAAADAAGAAAAAQAAAVGAQAASGGGGGGGGGAAPAAAAQPRQRRGSVGGTRCSVCRALGHNSRTCPEALAVRQ
jgi:hypothetical protein